MEVKDIHPIINTNFDVFSNTMQLNIRDDQSIQSVETCIINADNTTICEVNTLGENNPVFSATTTFSTHENTQGVYYIVVDNQGNSSRFPSCDFIKFKASSETTISLFINEIMADNESIIADETGAFEDWIELYNPTGMDMNLAGLFLSDKQDTPNKWRFPEVTIPAKGFLTIWADDDEGEGALHTNFKLSNNGEFIGIFDTEANDFTLIDGFQFGKQAVDISFGRMVDGGAEIGALIPSPNASNAQLTNLTNIFAKAINIYPNPTNHFFTIDLGQLNNQPENIFITNSLGQIFQTLPVIDFKLHLINTLDFPKGVYFTVVDFGKQGRLFRKIVVN